jgi:hypothetical protein
MHVDVIGAGWVKLHDRFLFVPKQRLYLAHLFPSRAAGKRDAAPVADGDTDVFPAGALYAWAIPIAGDAKKTVGARRDEETAVGVTFVRGIF